MVTVYPFGIAYVPIISAFHMLAKFSLVLELENISLTKDFSKKKK